MAPTANSETSRFNPKYSEKTLSMCGNETSIYFDLDLRRIITADRPFANLVIVA
jgi:hypothetical protein